jgi:hypothetical protein
MRIAATLTRLYKAALSRIKVIDETLLKLSERHGPALVDKWEKMDDTVKKINGEWTSVYVPRIKNGMIYLQINVLHLLMWLIGPPTQGHVYQKLIQAETVAVLAGQSAIGDAQMINTALDIECQQYVSLQIR